MRRSEGDEVNYFSEGSSYIPCIAELSKTLAASSSALLDLFFRRSRTERHRQVSEKSDYGILQSVFSSLSKRLRFANEV